MVVRYARRARRDRFDQSREEVAVFDDSKRAEQYLDSQMHKHEKDPTGSLIVYKLEEIDHTPALVQGEAVPLGPPAEYQQAVFQPVLPKIVVKIAIKDAIEQAIREAGGRAKLAQIYETVKRVKKLASKTPLESIRSDLYRGIEARRFVRNSDGTYSLGSKAGTTFQEYVSQRIPSTSGVLIGGQRLSPYHPKENEMEKDFEKYYREIFGDGALYIPIKKLIGSRIKKVTDGVMLDLDEKGRPSFWIVEIELASHDPESHIQSQVLGFLRALKHDTSIRILLNIVHEHLQNAGLGDEDFDWATNFFHEPSIKMRPRPLQPYQYLDSLLHRKAGVIIVIDEVRPELKEIVETISEKGRVRVVEFRSFKRNQEKVHTFSHVDTMRIS